MTCGLFSCFDPSPLFEWFPLNWFVGMGGILGVYVVGLKFFTTHSISVGESLISSVAFGKSLEKIPLLASVGVFIFSLGVSGLFPYSFSLSSHLWVCLSLSLTLWLAGVIVDVGNSAENFVAHLLPEGTPAPLWGLIVAVEIVSTLIRPISLGVRLMANTLAGHLFLSLISGMVWGPFFMVSIPVGVGAVLFEACVSVVQSVVFFLLLCSYWE